MSEEIKKCLVCSMQSEHRFKDCFSQDCECGCVEEIRNVPLPLEECPKWFRIVTRKAAQRFNRAHTKKGY